MTLICKLTVFSFFSQSSSMSKRDFSRYRCSIPRYSSIYLVIISLVACVIALIDSETGTCSFVEID